jgi:hypothetical protein
MLSLWHERKRKIYGKGKMNEKMKEMKNSGFHFFHFLHFLF